MTARWILKPFLTKAARDTRGAVAVEFALTVPFFLIFVIALIDFGRLFWIKSSMQFAVEETARYAMVNPDLAPATLVTYAKPVHQRHRHHLCRHVQHLGGNQLSHRYGQLQFFIPDPHAAFGRHWVGGALLHSGERKPLNKIVKI